MLGSELLFCVRLLLFLLAAPLRTSILAVVAPVVTALHPTRLRISIRCGEHHRRYCEARRNRQPCQGKKSLDGKTASDLILSHITSSCLAVKFPNRLLSKLIHVKKWPTSELWRASAAAPTTP